MVIIKENQDVLNRFFFHDLYISNISYDVKNVLYEVSLADDMHYKTKGSIYLDNVLHFKHSLFYPWNADKDGPLIISSCYVVNDIPYVVDQLNLKYRENLTIDNKKIYKSVGPAIELSKYFLFVILLSSGDTLEFLTDKLEVNGIKII